MANDLLSLDDDDLFDLEDPLEFDDSLLALEDDDDLLSLESDELPQAPRYDFTPSNKGEMVDFCRVVYKQYKAGSCQDQPYEGVHDAKGGCKTIGLVFQFWWEKYLRDSNRQALECAYMAASRLVAGLQHPDITSPKYPGEFITGEVMRADGHGNVFVAVRLPNTYAVQGNMLGDILKHDRMVWFNVKSGKPLDASEPFRMV